MVKKQFLESIQKPFFCKWAPFVLGKKECAKLRAQRAIVPHVPRALRAPVPRAIHALLLEVLRDLRAFVSYVPRALRALVPHGSFSRDARASCRACSFVPHPSLASGISGLTYASHVS